MGPGCDRRGEGGAGKPYAAGAAESLEAFIGARATAKDLAALTFFFKGVVSAFFPEPVTGDALTVRETAVKMVNEILVRLKESGSKLSGQDLEVIGFCLRRLYFVVQAYKKGHEQTTLDQWMTKLVQIAKDAGVPVPG